MNNEFYEKMVKVAGNKYADFLEKGDRYHKNASDANLWSWEETLSEYEGMISMIQFTFIDIEKEMYNECIAKMHKVREDCENKGIEIYRLRLDLYD